MATQARSETGLMHAGAGTALWLLQLSVIIPGLLPALALFVVFAAVIVLPIVAVGLVAAVLLAPPYLVVRWVRGRAQAP